MEPAGGLPWDSCSMTQRAGWYVDPENADLLRYWDGVMWTSHSAPNKSPTADQSTIGRAVAVPGSHAGPAAHRGAPRDGIPGGTPPPGIPGQAGAPSPYGQPPPAGYGAPGATGVQVLGGPTTPDGAPLAGWGVRAGARVIDMFITGAVSTLLGIPFLVSFASWYVGYLQRIVRDAERGVTTPLDQGQMQSEMLKYLLPISIISLVVSMLYETFFLVRSGQTPGKKVLGLRVRLRDRPGPLSVADALRRQVITVGTNLLSLVPIVMTFTFILMLADYLFPLWDRNRQALHDKVARTNVVVDPRRR